MIKEKVLIIGAGYVGLPLAVRCAEAGYKTYIHDIDATKTQKINAGISYIGDITSAQLQSALPNLTAFPYTNFFEHIQKPDIILICVPTPLNKTKDPDISFVIAAAESIRDNFLQPNALVILESTVYPTFTREVLAPILNHTLVAFSAERVDPSNERFHTKNTPKVVGGLNPEATKKAMEFYKQIIDTPYEVSTVEVAEMSKILENTFRMINIGLANEIALSCAKLNIDVWEVIQAAATKPFGFMPFYPGAGVGGHCALGSTKLNYMYYYPNRRACSLVEGQTIEEVYNNVKDIENMRIRGFDGNDIVWTKVSFFGKRNFTGKLYTIILENDQSISITDEHPMLVYENGKLNEVFAKDIQLGQLLPSSKFNSIGWDLIPLSPVSIIQYEEVVDCPVYSIECDTHNFIADNILIHNCIALDPHYLSWKMKMVKSQMKFVELAEEINSFMPKYVVQLASDVLNDIERSIKGSTILVAGIAYKPNIDDVRESPALDVMELLEAKGATVLYHDPLVPSIRWNGEVKYSSEIVPCDCCVVIANHKVMDYNKLIENSKAIVDTRNALKNYKIICPFKRL